MTIAAKPTTAEELLAMEDSRRFELYNGELRTVSPANSRHANIGVQIASLLQQFVNPRLFLPNRRCLRLKYPQIPRKGMNHAYLGRSVLAIGSSSGSSFISSIMLTMRLRHSTWNSFTSCGEDNLFFFQLSDWSAISC